MALPQQVVDRLSKENMNTPGWSYGVIVFSGGIFALSLLIYLGLTFGYEPYLQNQVSNLQTQVATQSNAISSSDQASLVTFYSEITNVQTALTNHIYFSRFLSWLSQNTEANVTYGRLTFASGNEVSLTATAPQESDVNEQAAIFQSSPAVKSFTISGVTSNTGSGGWQFNITLTVDPTQVLEAPSSASAATNATGTTQ